jgi:hypothetical protein
MQEGAEVMSERPEVKVGQVWREKSKRFARYIRLVGFVTAPLKENRVRTRPCNADGSSRSYGPTTKIKVSNIQTRFELVIDV